MREERDSIEREFKVSWSPTVTAANALIPLYGMVPDEFVLVEGNGRIVLDIYLDTSSRDFLRSGASLRLRQRRSGKWRANFKPPSDAGLLMRRREVRTDLSVSEAGGYEGWTTGGLAFTEARAFLNRCDLDSTSETFKSLEPTLLLANARRFYSVARKPVEGGIVKAFPGLMYLVFDDVAACVIGREDMEGLLNYGTMLAREHQRRHAFRQIELEIPSYAREPADRGMEVGRRLRDYLVSLGCAAVTETKYQTAARGLGYQGVD